MRIQTKSEWMLVVFGLLAFFVITATQSFAQSDGYNTNSNLRGVVPFGTYQFGEIDNVNLASGTVNLRIPLVSRPGRGSSEGRIFVYSSKIWVTRPIPHPEYPYDWRSGEANIVGMAWEPTAELYHGRIVSTGSHGGELQWTENWYTCTYIGAYGYPYSYNVFIRSNFSLRAPDGASYQFPNRKVTKDQQYPDLSQCITPMAGPPPPPADERTILVGYSDSGTMELDITGTNFLVRFKDGGVASYDGTQFGSSFFQWYKDRNGNIIDSNGDTLKRTLFKASDGQSVGGATSQSDVPTTTQFPTTGGGCVYQFQGDIYVTTSLTLTNGQQFTFEYDPVFRELTRVNLPTGGYIRYVYQTFSGMDDAPPMASTTCVTSLDSRRVVERRVSSDGVNEKVWTYNYLLSGATEVTDPLGNVSIHLFVDRQHEYSSEIRNASGAVLRRSVNNWVSDFGPVQVNQDGTHQWRQKNARIALH